ncbi:MAG: cysteine peptidase family C39 domain-containing protein, partial [Synergistota bacterium]|nr:cysteine peptidase family C39 domain-containing protein [Synergistota bacterium]
MLFKKPFPFFRQHEAVDCGPACLHMIAQYYGRLFPLSWLRQKSSATREGSSLKGLAEAAEAMGMKTRCVLASMEFLAGEAPLPCVVHWERNHFVVVYGRKRGRFLIADPAFGKQAIDEKTFMGRWSDGGNEGYALLMEPSEFFYVDADSPEPRRPVSFLLSYIRPHLQMLSQIFLAMILGSAIQLTLPFLTRMTVDRGIYGNDIGLLKLILSGQFVLILGRTCSYFLRDLVLFHISTPVNISLVYDFLTKLSRLPLEYFDTRRIGDTLQRLNDHQRIESFITRSILGLVFSIMNMAVFGFVLAL